MKFLLQIYLMSFLNAISFSSSGLSQEVDIVNGKYCNALCRAWMGLPQQLPLDLHPKQLNYGDYRSLDIDPGHIRAKTYLHSDLDHDHSHLMHEPPNSKDNIDLEYLDNPPRDSDHIIPWIEARRFLLRPDVTNGNIWARAGLNPIEDGFSTVLGLSRSVFGGLIRPFFNTTAIKHAEPNENKTYDGANISTSH